MKRFCDDGEARWRRLAESVPQIVWTVIPGGGLDYCNRRWYDLAGLPKLKPWDMVGPQRSTPTTVP